MPGKNSSGKLGAATVVFIGVLLAVVGIAIALTIGTIIAVVVGAPLVAIGIIVLFWGLLGVIEGNT